jgi:hypothetical protein
MNEAALGHDLVAAKIAAFADGELTGREVRGVERHLWECSRCRRALLVQRYLWWALGRERIAPAPEALRRRLERIGEQPASLAPVARSHPR